MKLIFSSSTRLCLLAFCLAIIIGLFVGKVSEDTFKIAAMMVLTAFFSMKSSSNDAIAGK